MLKSASSKPSIYSTNAPCIRPAAGSWLSATWAASTPVPLAAGRFKYLCQIDPVKPAAQPVPILCESVSRLSRCNFSLAGLRGGV